MFSVADAEALLAAPWAARVHRVLVEILDEEDDGDAAVAQAREVDALVAPLGRPRLWHAQGRATWAVVGAARAIGLDVRVGFEDVLAGRGRAAGGEQRRAGARRPGDLTRPVVRATLRP